MADPVPWTFAAAGECVEHYEALTDVLPAATGSEQRRGLRSAPRISVEFDGLDSGHTLRQMEHLLHANGAGRWRVPWSMDGGVLAADLALGSSAIAVDTRWRRYRAGGYALLLGATARDWELVQVDALTDTTLTLAAPTVRAWKAGTAIFPTALCRLEGVPSLQRFTADAVPYRVRFQLDEVLDWPASAGAASYRSTPVLELAHDWSSDPVWTPARQLEEVDNGTALPARFDLVGIPLGTASRGYTLVTMEQIAAFRSLLYYLDGRRCPIWVPSLAADFVPVAAVANGATTLDVAWTGYSAWPVAEGRRDIRIQLRNGTILYRRITAAASISGGAAERLTLGAAIATGFAAADVALVSFMVPCRQEADTTVLRGWAAGVAMADLGFRGLRDGI